VAVEARFVVLRDRPGGRLNQYSLLGHDPVQIPVRGDRGEWDVSVSVDAGRTFWQVDLPEAYLDGHPWIGEPSSEEHQADFVRSRLDHLRERLGQDPGACAELYRLADEWMSRRFRIPIPDGGFPGRKPC
jgi:glutathione S-transferase